MESHHRAASTHSLTAPAVEIVLLLLPLKLRGTVLTEILPIIPESSLSPSPRVVAAALFPVPVKLPDKLLQSLRTTGADGTVIDAEHPQRRLSRRLAPSKAFLKDV